MFHFSRPQLIKGLAAIFFILGISWLALDYFVPSPPSKITIATAFKGSTFQYYGRRYKTILARAGVKVELRETAGGVENLKLLQDPKSGVDVAFVTGDVSGSSQVPGLLSLGPIFTDPFWIFYADSEPIERLSQLKGKRISVGPVGSGTRFSAEKILNFAGINSETATLLPFAGLDAVRALRDGRVDVAWINGGANSPTIQALLKDPKVRLMDFELAEAFTRIFPNLIRVVLPKGVIQIDPPNPPNDLTLLGTTTRVLIRSDLHPAIVQLLARAIKEVHGGQGLLHRRGEFPMMNDPEYPMSQIAVEYYKNGPSLLQKYLPFRMTVYAQRAIAALIATLAIIFPAFSLAPRLYVWIIQSHLRKLYRRLRVVEDALHWDVTVPQAEALQRELADIDRAAKTVSIRNADLIFIFRYHLERIHSILASRLAEAQNPVQRSDKP
jgi:TRAP transporter TAXI family solute receptor